MLRPSAPNKENLKGFLRRRADYLKTYKGRYVRKDLLVLYARRNEREEHRFGVTAPKTVGTAVVRNRFKRWSKEIYRKMDVSGFADGTDFNALIGNKRKKKEDFKNVRFSDFEHQLNEAFREASRIFAKTK